MNPLTILTAIKSLWSNPTLRYIIIGVISVIVVIFVYINRIDAAYGRGVDYQKEVYAKEQQTLKEEYQKKLDVANTEREATNAQLSNIKTAYAQLQAQREVKQTTQKNEVKEYAKTSDGNKRCIDPKWMQLYANGLPD